ncbi:PLP-dependent aminotransferase family protein [uncultured Tateyamaria sp.]|uniref:aminotransferase-like domain-containing protein n=1 Tax=uncultured Tateyamaria sp. TaxID=455651 RepID=UPI002631439E|nr:PLP-dependent aminotransferase family protein [uncultured Tateyamaria sp.]
MTSADWTPDIAGSDRPLYAAIADAIAADIVSGRLTTGDRLPPQRRVAAATGLDVSTISRGYAEAVRRDLVEAHVGRGTFVKDPHATGLAPDPRRTLEEDPHMNMPPEPDDADLIGRMQAGLAHVSANIISLLRYQTPTGSAKDREIAARWMQANGAACAPDRLVVTAGAHAAIEAALSVLRGPDTVVLSEAVTYPGIRAIAGRLALPLVGLAEDGDGVRPDALDQAIAAHPKAILYLNPTLRNPTTQTMPDARRRQIAAILDGHGVPLIEDDAYHFVAAAAPPALSGHVPHLAWRVSGISKVFGAGLRLAYVQVPDATMVRAFVQALRATHVMTNPVSLALLSTWMEDGTATALQRFVRTEARYRQAMAARVLDGYAVLSDPLAYNIWLTLPAGVTRAAVLSAMARQPLGIVPSDAFTVAGAPAESVRVCLGGPVSRPTLETGLQALAGSLSGVGWSG